MAETRISRPARILLALRRHSGQRWFLPAVGLFPLSDYVLPVLPNQMLLVGLSMTLPRRRVAIGAVFVLATALGAFLAAMAIQAWGKPFVDAALGGLPDTSAMAEVMAAIEGFGLAALAGLSMLPWAPRSAVVVCSLAGLSPIGIAAAVGMGRTVPTTIYATLGASAPHLLRRYRPFDRMMQEVEAGKPMER